MAKVIGIRADEELVRALDRFAADGQMSRAVAAGVLLAKGLGLARLEAEKAQRTAPGELAAEEAPEGLEIDLDALAAAVRTDAGGEINGIQMALVRVDADGDDPELEALLESKLFGLTAAEWKAVVEEPEFTWRDPATVRARVFAIIDEAARLKIDRHSAVHAAYFSARVGGLDPEAARAVLEDPSPFTLPGAT